MIGFTNAEETLDARALDLYDNRLKALLEPDESGRFVAIHPETEAFATGRNSPEARRNLRRTNPTGYILTRRIGSEPDYALVARLLAGEMAQGATK